MSTTANQGLWFSSFTADVAANLPTSYPGDGNFALFYATDTGALYLATKPAAVQGVYGSPTWFKIAIGNANLVPIATEAGVNGATWDSTHHTLVIPSIPTASTGLATGSLWSNSHVVNVV